jgi:azurin
MKSRHVLAASALALALSACGQSPAPTAEPPVAAPATEEAAAPAPVEAAPVAPAPVAATGSKPATVADCATTIEGNDAMQYNADSITIPASCTQFTITLKHAGAMAVNVMGHNVVVAKEADMAGIAADGMSLTPEHVKPDDDARIIAHTRMVGWRRIRVGDLRRGQGQGRRPVQVLLQFPRPPGADAGKPGGAMSASHGGSGGWYQATPPPCEGRPVRGAGILPDCRGRMCAAPAQAAMSPR